MPPPFVFCAISPDTSFHLFYASPYPIKALQVSIWNICSMLYGFGNEIALVPLFDNSRRRRRRSPPMSLSSILLGILSLGWDSGAVASILVGRWVWEDIAEALLFCTMIFEFPQKPSWFPMLFCIYMKPLGETARRSGLQCGQHVDDIQFSFSFPSDSKVIAVSLSPCIWRRSNMIGVWRGRSPLKDPTKNC